MVQAGVHNEYISMFITYVVQAGVSVAEGY